MLNFVDWFEQGPDGETRVVEKPVDYNQTVQSCVDLPDLLDTLIAFEELRDMQDTCSPRTDAGEGIEQRFGIVLSELPTFGGDEPSDTCEVWSWDETRLLVGNGPCSGWAVVSRSDSE